MKLGKTIELNHTLSHSICASDGVYYVIVLWVAMTCQLARHNYYGQLANFNTIVCDCESNVNVFDVLYVCYINKDFEVGDIGGHGLRLVVHHCHCG